MLKIKDNIDLKELEKFGFEKYIDDDGYVLDFITYIDGKEYSYIEITKERKISLDYVELEHYQQSVEVLFDLIQAGLVEKVEGE